MLLRYGALRTYRTWHTKCLGAYQELGLKASRQYAPEAGEVFYVALDTYCSLGVMVGYEVDAGAVLDAVGLDAVGQQDGFDLYWAEISKGERHDLRSWRCC